MGSFTSSLQEKLAKNGCVSSKYCQQDDSCHCLIITNIAKNRSFRLYFLWFWDDRKQYAIAHIWEGSEYCRKNQKSLGENRNRISGYWFADWNKNGNDITKNLKNNGLSIDNVVTWVSKHIEYECGFDAF